MPDTPTINPYNFVPLAENDPERTCFPGWLRVASKGYSGRLSCDLEALSPLFSADHQQATGQSAIDKRKWFPFLRNSQGQPILQGTTLKGMVRAVYETLSNSCLPLAATAGTSKKAGNDVDYGFYSLTVHHHQQCISTDKLCPACRLFGVIQGDEIHAQGRVIFTDAVLCQGRLGQKKVYLKELSSPKPHHYQIYSKTQQPDGPIAGRKFFYHHDLNTNPGVEFVQWSTRANGATEFAPTGTRFTFAILFNSLPETELAFLVRSLVLDTEFGHKVGMGKPIGFGSCRIHIKVAESFQHQGGSRYQTWSSSPIRIDVEDLKTKAGPLPPALREVLRFDKYQDGTIGYLPFAAYEGVRIDSQGKYKTGKVTPARTVQGTGATIGARILHQRKTQAKSSQGASGGKIFKKGDKIRVEILTKEGDQYTLRVRGTGQEVHHEQPYLPWQKGKFERVTVESVGPDGLIKKIRP